MTNKLNDEDEFAHWKEQIYYCKKYKKAVPRHQNDCEQFDSVHFPQGNSCIFCKHMVEDDYEDVDGDNNVQYSKLEKRVRVSVLDSGGYDCEWKYYEFDNYMSRLHELGKALITIKELEECENVDEKR